MSRKDTRTKITETAKKPVHETKADKDSDTKMAMSASWQATEPGPHKRWWWYVGFTIASLWVIDLLVLMHEWLALACAVTAVLAILIVYNQKPKLLHYCIEKHEITVEGQAIILDNYRAFTTEPGIDGLPIAALLLPKRRISLPFEIALPSGDVKREAALNNLKSLLPFDEAKSYQGNLRLLERITRWLRLS
jgi:hypothetical protein